MVQKSGGLQVVHPPSLSVANLKIFFFLLIKISLSNSSSLHIRYSPTRLPIQFEISISLCTTMPVLIHHTTSPDINTFLKETRVFQQFFVCKAESIEATLFEIKWNADTIILSTFSAQSTLVIKTTPGWTASGPLKSLATLSYCGYKIES